MKAYATLMTGTDGMTYSVRLMATADEISGYQAAGVIGEACEIIGMQDAADSLVAELQKQNYTASGGILQ